jgi:tRNA/rRNA methyltransferase
LVARKKGLAGTAGGAEIPDFARIGAPCVILVHPQLGENIGMAARAMANFALTDLRLVRPRDGWPSQQAVAASSGASFVIDNARVFDEVEDAIADLNVVYATTARERGLMKPVVTPQEAAKRIRQDAATGHRSGLMFGGERAGLDNDHVALADAALMVPVNPAFASLNLAQAVLLTGYEWFKAGDNSPPMRIDDEETRLANKQELLALFEHLEGELDASGFLRPPEKRASMIRNLRTMWSRANLYEQDVRTWRGIIKALTEFNRNNTRKT